ncbi:uncharacterized protein DNG_09472 [Cephalotrichum gorgonifer]|uniref:Zn(2)-C6 fungal-type domain-containing protein n=1 Tax=Cephalotrichum gorgonifer TaxID=2041049 RepID=A0AAE8SZF8_9PEZI|nr:uncharacterized protein DNG_09472 [Cephalotrichum gorgonifer]
MTPAIKSRSARVSRPARTGTTALTCKTCTPCRQRKVKCDGTRPKCHDCVANGLGCVYPRDARRELRPTKAQVQSLEHTVSVMLEHMSASGFVFPGGSAGIVETGSLQEQGSPPAGHSPVRSTAPASCSPPPPLSMFSTTTQSDIASLPELETNSIVSRTPPIRRSSTDGFHPHFQSVADEEVVVVLDKGDGASSMSNALSPCEARVAGVFHEHGCVSSVHGLAGIMNPTSREQHTENISKLTRRGDAAIAESRARLISNAALQKQRELRMFRQPQDLMDLDGCNPELAKHLLDLHFNRQHYAYLISYRPAIMDSLFNGRGPWANKLLLNAIFYSSALYSDRECLRSGPGDTESAGLYFYNRFRQLLVDGIETPSIASTMALLLTSASLVSQGRSSAGWSLSGTAYRMIMDLGCHMMLGPDYQSNSSQISSGRRLHRDLEQEMRTRLYWGAYVTDATQALYLGRPCMFASVEARVPLQLLDTFEELEDWQPYVDPQAPAPAAQPTYVSQPAHAVSTFTALARLFQISTRITDLYGIQSIKLSTERLLDKKRSIEWELNSWKNNLPSHLRFHPDETSITPPPHQVTPHTTFHALTILLHRAFLEQGHLRRHSDDDSKRRGEDACINSALMIEKYVRAYREAFTLRRAPFLLSYAVYSAVSVILHWERDGRGKLTESISFFWTCLNELQRGCNFGLKKPLRILREMVHGLQFSVDEGDRAEPDRQLEPSLDDSLLFRFPARAQDASRVPQIPGPDGQGIMAQTPPDYWNPIDSTALDMLPTEMSDFLNDQSFLNENEMDIYQDSLYGLFAPSPHLHLP